MERLEKKIDDMKLDFVNLHASQKDMEKEFTELKQDMQKSTLEIKKAEKETASKKNKQYGHKENRMILLLCRFSLRIPISF